jgi:CBS domain-containing protein
MAAGVAHSDVLPDSKDRRQWRRLQPLHTVTPSTPLTAALGLLLEAGVSALPVVDEGRCLLDIYARRYAAALPKGIAQLLAEAQLQHSLHGMCC